MITRIHVNLCYVVRLSTTDRGEFMQMKNLIPVCTAILKGLEDQEEGFAGIDNIKSVLLTTGKYNKGPYKHLHWLYVTR